MKKLKSNNRILFYLICFSLLAFVNISCETENELESFIEASEVSEEIETSSKSMAKGNIKRTRLKQRRNGLYRTSIVVNNDPKNTVSIIALEIAAKKGFINETKTYYLNYFTTVKKEKYYTFADIKFENPNIVNQEVNIKVTLLDADKKAISTSTTTTVIEGLSNANIKRTRLKKRSNGMYKMTAEIENNEENDVAEVAVSVYDLYGNSAKDKTKPKNTKNNDPMLLFLLNEKGEIAIKGKVFKVIYTLTDLYGDVMNTFEEEITVESDIKIGKIILKEISTGLYTALVTVKRDNENQVNTIALEIEKEEGFITEPKNYALKYLKTIKGVKHYTFDSVKFENKEKVNQEITLKITLLDVNSNLLEKPKRVRVSKRQERIRAAYKERLSSKEV
jgi:hypothetical protein